MLPIDRHQTVIIPDDAEGTLEKLRRGHSGIEPGSKSLVRHLQMCSMRRHFPPWAMPFFSIEAADCSLTCETVSYCRGDSSTPSVGASGNTRFPGAIRTGSSASVDQFIRAHYKTNPFSCCHLSSRAPIFAANVARDPAWCQKGLANRYWRLRRHRCLRENPARCRGGR